VLIVIVGGETPPPCAGSRLAVRNKVREKKATPADHKQKGSAKGFF